VVIVDCGEEYGRFVSRMAARWFAEEPATRHRAIDGTLVFADVSGFTALSERLAVLGREGAEVLTEHIDAVFAELLGGAHAAGGDLLSYGGDAVVLWFEGEEHARRAVSAGAEMRATVQRVGRRQTATGAVRLRMSIGIHSGTVEALLVGDAHRDLLLTGPAVSRLVETEAAASAGQILVSAETAAHLPKGTLGARVGPAFLLARGPGAKSRSVAAGASAPAALVPVALRDELAGGGQPPEHRVLAMAFIHVFGIDRLAADPRALVDAVDRSLGIVQRHLAHHGVTYLSSDIDDDGFKVIALAGAPAATDDQEERLLRAVQAIVTDAGIPLPVRAGAHRGAAFVGAVGAADRAAYTVMGDAVNTTARIMSKAQPGQLLATPDILGRSATTFVVEPLEPFLAKGKRQPLQASLVGPPVGVRPRELARLPLVGRAAERQQLLEAWSAARDGHGSVVEILGDAGIGKSRLIVEVADAARLAGATVVQIQAEAYQQATAHFVSTLLLRRAQGTDHDRADANVAEAPDEATSIRAIAAAIDESLGRTPTLVIVEDGHWADEPSLAVLGALALADRPVLVVVARRPGACDLAASTTIALGGVDDASIGALLAAARGRRGILPERLRAVTELAGGNPQHAIALALCADEEELPDDLEAAVAMRIDRLPPIRRTMLRELSVLGTRFETQVAIGLLGEPDALALLDGYVEIGDGWTRFRSALERDAAYAGMPYRRRRALHARAGDLIAASTDHPESRAEALSAHYFAAGDPSRTLRFASVAAERATALSSLALSAQHYERAVWAARRTAAAPDELARLLRGLCVGRSYAGDFDGAVRAGREARRADRDLIGHVSIAVLLTEQAATAGDWVRSAREARQALRLIDAAPASEQQRVRPDRVLLLGSLARCLHTLGRQPAAARAAAEMVALAKDLDDPASEARALALRAQLEPDPLAGARCGDAAADIYRRIGNRGAVGIVLNNAANRLRTAGLNEEAERRYEEAIAILEEQGEDQMVAVVRTNTLPLTNDRGDWEAALAAAGSCAATFEAIGMLPALTAALGQEAFAYVCLGRDDVAQARDRFLALVEQGEGDDDDTALAWELAALTGDRVTARRIAGACPPSPTADPRVHARLALSQAWLDLQEGVDGAASALARLGREAEANRMPTLAAVALAGVGRLDDARRIMDAAGMSRIAVPPRQTGGVVEVIDAAVATVSGMEAKRHLSAT
jgi:class 3 adenylate cyclase